jgi:methylmalonyl-CoA mutase N-terminal domain/subunit
MRQYAGFSTAEETNRRFRYLLEQGQTGLSIAFDLPTQIGYDPDHPFSEGEVGKVGVSIAHLDDLDHLLDGIPLEKVSISMTINATASILLAMLVVLARRRGVAPSALRGTIQNDILKEYVARGTYRFPVRPSMRLITDTFRYARSELPLFNPISISGYHMREAGCTAVQEIAFTLAHGIAYVEAAVEAGLDVDSFAQRLSFFFNAHNDFLEEVAKFRAARRLWARIMRERFKARKDASCMLRFHTQTAGSTLTAAQPDVNIVRVTLQALAAVLGGTQSLHTNSRDEALALPTEVSARIALRTQQVIACESGVTSFIDPLGGAPLVEAITDRLEAEASELIERIDQLGGAMAAVENGFTASEIHKAAYAYQKAVEKGETVVVGVNRFRIDERPPTGLLRVDDTLREQRMADLEALRNRRNGARVARSLDRLKKDGASEIPLLPGIVECVESSATVGEICASFEEVFGPYRSQPV